MTSSAQAVAAMDELSDQLQILVEDGRFTPRFFDRLFGLRTVLGGARERFAADHAASSAEAPLFATVLESANTAVLLGRELAPTVAGVARYGRAVERVVEALAPAPVPATATSRRRRRATT